MRTALSWFRTRIAGSTPESSVREQQQGASDSVTSDDDDDMLDEYDLDALGPPEVGKYYEAYHRARNWVFIDGDLIGDFPDAKAVNDALRALKHERARSRPKTLTR